MAKALPAFEIDRAGLANVLARRGKSWLALELVQNALDADGVTRVDVKLEAAGRGRAVLSVEDDSPAGFQDLRHAYTLFGGSTKGPDPTKRGRFDVGEKLVIATSISASVVSTTGGYRWDERGRHRMRSRREVGSLVTVELRLTQEELYEALCALRMVLVPAGVALSVNGGLMPRRASCGSLRVQLPTEATDDEGRLRVRERQTEVLVYERTGTEPATLYELGLPLEQLEGDEPWHISVEQRIPLPVGRETVSPAYLRRLRAAVLDWAAREGMLSDEASSSPWVSDALEGPVEAETVRATVVARYGDRAVVRDPSDPESNKIAVMEGYTVVEPASLSKEVWAKVREAEALRPAGQVTPSPAVVFSPAGKDCTYRGEVTEGMQAVVDWTARAALVLLGLHVEVELLSSAQSFGACYSRERRRIAFNVRSLSQAWFATGPRPWVAALVLHELAHERIADHLSRQFADECCRLGVLLAEHPELVVWR